MTWTSDLAICALWFGAGAAAAWCFTMLHYQSRLSAATQSANLFAAWWERDSAKMLVAQAQLDLIHQQHVDAGRKAHEPWKALRRETTDKLMDCLANRDNPPSASKPALGIPAGRQRPQRKSGRRQVAPLPGQDTGAGILPDATPRASEGNSSFDPCRRNRAGHSAPAETPEMKGASNG